ncbi:MAG: hypothetical protein KBD63_01030 [Bacteriovoracaceae bacterium]|nr:hypothetical protein [Bacteriovoracaceae bacterium]
MKQAFKNDSPTTTSCIGFIHLSKKSTFGYLQLWYLSLFIMIFGMSVTKLFAQESGQIQQEIVMGGEEFSPLESWYDALVDKDDSYFEEMKVTLENWQMQEEEMKNFNLESIYVGSEQNLEGQKEEYVVRGFRRYAQKKLKARRQRAQQGTFLATMNKLDVSPIAQTATGFKLKLKFGFRLDTGDAIVRLDNPLVGAVARISMNGDTFIELNKTSQKLGLTLRSQYRSHEGWNTSLEKRLTKAISATIANNQYENTVQLGYSRSF